MHALRMLAGFSLIGGAVLTFMADEALYQAISLVARRYVSPDHQITPLGEQLIGRITYLVVTGLLIIGGALVGLSNASLRARVHRAFSYGPACPGYSVLPQGRLFVLSTGVGILFFGLFYY